MHLIQIDAPAFEVTWVEVCPPSFLVIPRDDCEDHSEVNLELETVLQFERLNVGCDVWPVEEDIL
ncbi:hypothetical protein CFB50_33985 [Burkholderia sp. AU33423]|nr:hypothetical protein CFB50_33985 [Burkholderia sp. AU33423]